MTVYLDDAVGRELTALAVRFGAALFSERARLEAYLRDVAPGRYAEIHCILCAVDEGVAAALLDPLAGVPMQAMLVRLADRLRERTAIDADAAAWAVSSLAAAVEAASGTVPADAASGAGRKTVSDEREAAVRRAPADGRGWQPPQARREGPSPAMSIPSWESASPARLPPSRHAVARSAFAGTWRLSSPAGPAEGLRAEPSGDNDLAVSLMGGSPARLEWRGVLTRFDLNRFVSAQMGGSRLQVALSGGGTLCIQFQGAVAEYGKVAGL